MTWHKGGKNSKYKPEGTVKLLIYISLNRTSAESWSNDLAEDMDVPSPDAMLMRLKSINTNDAVNALNEIN